MRFLQDQLTAEFRILTQYLSYKYIQQAKTFNKVKVLIIMFVKEKIEIKK